MAVHIDKTLIVDGVYRTSLANPIARGGRTGDYFEVTPATMFDMPARTDPPPRQAGSFLHHYGYR